MFRNSHVFRMRGIPGTSAGDEVSGGNARHARTHLHHGSSTRVAESVHTVETIQYRPNRGDGAISQGLLPHLSNEVRLRAGLLQETQSAEFHGGPFGAG